MPERFAPVDDNLLFPPSVRAAMTAKLHEEFVGPAWIDIPLASTVTASTVNKPQYRIIGAGPDLRIELRGGFTVDSSTTTIGTFPNMDTGLLSSARTTHVTNVNNSAQVGIRLSRTSGLSFGTAQTSGVFLLDRVYLYL